MVKRVSFLICCLFKKKSNKMEENSSTSPQTTTVDDERSRTIFCANLSDRVTESILYELFLQAGPVNNVYIPKDKDGCQRNYGFITYTHLASVAYGLFIFQGTKLFNRELTLKQSYIQNQNGTARNPAPKHHSIAKSQPGPSSPHANGDTPHTNLVHNANISHNSSRNEKQLQRDASSLRIGPTFLNPMTNHMLPTSSKQRQATTEPKNSVSGRLGIPFDIGKLMRLSGQMLQPIATAIDSNKTATTTGHKKPENPFSNMQNRSPKIVQMNRDTVRTTLPISNYKRPAERDRNYSHKRKR